ncbi:MAG: protein translocase subunit SecF, partial [Desulfobacterales bacterium]|nr:protein translocase subunit SecF [Desulfobacterales bacterium]
MIQLIKPNININFIGLRKIAYGFSLTLIVLTFLSITIHKGLNFGIDFSGGMIVQVKFAGPVKADNIKSAFTSLNIENTSVQRYGKPEENEYLIRIGNIGADTKELSNQLYEALKSKTASEPEIRRVEMVGPQVGKDLR